MIEESTKEKLRNMKLTEMLEAYEDEELTLSHLDMTFDQRFAHLIEDTYQRKYNRTVARLIKSAHFRYNCDISGIVYKDGRNLDKTLMIELAACDFIRANKALIITGSAGTGKTWISCAIGKQACKLGYKTQYIRMPDLFERAGIYGSRKTIDKYSKYDLLILDEWLLYPLEDAELTLMLELLERRYDSKSTVFATIYATTEWYPRLGEAVRADSIMERIVHNKIDVTLGSLKMRAEQH